MSDKTFKEVFESALTDAMHGVVEQLFGDLEKGWVSINDRLPEHEKCSKYLVEVVTPRNTYVDLIWWNCGWINFENERYITRWHEVPFTGNRI